MNNLNDMKRNECCGNYLYYWPLSSLPRTNLPEYCSAPFLLVIHRELDSVIVDPSWSSTTEDYSSYRTHDCHLSFVYCPLDHVLNWVNPDTMTMVNYRHSLQNFGYLRKNSIQIFSNDPVDAADTGVEHY